MSSRIDDIQYIRLIQQNITQKITAHKNHLYILYGDFNKDIRLIGRQNELNTTPLQTEDVEWRTFTYNFRLSYIYTNSTFSR